MFSKRLLYLLSSLTIAPVLTMGIQACKSGPTVEEIDRLLTEQLPTGSSETQVRQFLDTHKIEHSAILDHPETESDFRDLKIETKSSVKEYMIAIIRNTDRKGLTTGNIQMFFYFDDKGQMVARSVRWVGTGF